MPAMTLIHPFAKPPAAELPLTFPSPFRHIPAPLAQQAATELQQQLDRQPWSHDFQADGGGKLFGVLVVRDGDGGLGYVAAFEGELADRWQWPGFVPPIFDPAARQALIEGAEAELVDCRSEIDALQNSDRRTLLLQALEEIRRQAEAEIHSIKTEQQQRKAARAKLRDGADAELMATLARESQHDKRAMQACKQRWQMRIEEAKAQLVRVDGEIEQLTKHHAKLNKQLRKQLLAGYQLINYRGEQQLMAKLFDTPPPPGSGDCAATKLLHYANRHRLMPIALAEFWWGATAKDSLRRHSHYYPACRGRCGVILPFLLQGLDVEMWSVGELQFPDPNAPEIMYEDEVLLVVNKPAGLLSVPGKTITDSVYTRMQQRYPDAPELLLVHRLDMSTSGLILIAKNAAIPKALQKQFLQRTVDKRYVAVLSKRLVEGKDEGTIELPMRVDILDRPRQVVDFEHGKHAKTEWQVIVRNDHTTRVYFHPITGRTHQLRIHAAHPDGLNAPIVGDELYGQCDERLLLHAEYLCFTHPLSRKRVEVTAPTPF